MCCVFEILISLCFVYILIGWIFCGIVIYTAPKEFEKQVKTKKIIGVLTFSWPFFVYIFFKRKLNNDED